MTEILTPPESLTPPALLTPPAPALPVPEQKAAGMVQLDETTIKSLQARAREFVDEVVQLPVNSEPFNDKVNAIHGLGNKEIRASAAVSNRMLERPVKAMESGVFDESSQISASLVDLRRTVEDLDPSKQGDLFSPRKLLGVIPLGNRIRDYFLKYQSAQGHLNAIINTLYRSQDELRMDNAVIEQEKVNLWETMQKLQQYIYLGTNVDATLETRVMELDATDPEKARIIREEMLFYVRQKVQDLLTQLAVSIQGYLALDLIRKNNLELIKGVDRATTTTVSALRTAIIVAQALGNQKLVLDQINALNTTTGNLIESTSVMLKQQTADVYQQASSATVSVEKLQTAFDNIYETIDAISTYKLAALDSMRTTVNTLGAEVERANTYLDRVRQQELAAATDDLTVPALKEKSPEDLEL
jgi:uncharacterized protein YaaN involved in tellurite resistance